MRVRQHHLGAVALAAAVAILAVGCSSSPAHVDGPHAAAADQAAPPPPAAAPSTTAAAGATATAGSPTATSSGPASAANLPSTTGPANSTAAAGTPGTTAPSAVPSGTGGADPVDAAARFTQAYYTYDWQQASTLDPVERARPYATEAYLVTLRPTQTNYAARMTAAQETSTATIRTAAVSPDAPPATDTEAFVTVSYSQHLTDRGAPTDNQSSWNLHVVKTAAGGWRVDAVVGKG
ncbi:hypothetical protein ACFV1W_25365 [Kitasatospora sp. NPDC059648]|uniref:hypothetical protein n=1 Tax=Kitasatospora sp. NPDC059648 TaxID=3346894 RepID=UPI0036AE3E73